MQKLHCPNTVSVGAHVTRVRINSHAYDVCQVGRQEVRRILAPHVGAACRSKIDCNQHQGLPRCRVAPFLASSRRAGKGPTRQVFAPIRLPLYSDSGALNLRAGSMTLHRGLGSVVRLVLDGLLGRPYGRRPS